MPFWPFFMGAAALLTVWGIRRGAWIAPALALAGYIGTRAIMTHVNPTFHEITVCAWWLFCTCGMLYYRAYVPGFFYTLSAMMYPLFLIVGVEIGRFSVSNIVAECFAVLALGSIAGGLAGLSYSGLYVHGHSYRLASFALGMALRESSVAKDRGEVTSG